MTTLIQYLRMMDEMHRRCHQANKAKVDDWKHQSMEDFVLTEGVQCHPQVFPEKMYDRGPLKQCFMNAFALMVANPDLRYAEGYGQNIIPTMHAWCVDKDLNVIDPTWRDPEASQYFGVVFDRDFVIETVLKKETYGVIDNYQENFPLLQGKQQKDFLDMAFV
jgi:hypothetical protein